MFHFSLKGLRAYIFFAEDVEDEDNAEDDSSQSRHVPNYVITEYFFNWTVKLFYNYGFSIR